ncbi:MAG: P1 family peptidase [Lachnospiraceae bacterium]
MKEIKITDIEGIRIGHAQDMEGGTGCTVILCEQGAPTGLDVKGGGPASRESELLNPVAACTGIHGILLSGGSAFGLDAAGGVMQYLEEREIGFDTGVAKVPLVCQSDIFDLSVGDKNCRPDRDMAYAACVDSEQNQPKQGNVGAGTGASVGKLAGMEQAMKSGIGMYAVQLGQLKVGACVVVNALGDIFDYDTGKQLAGMLNPAKDGFQNSEQTIYQMLEAAPNLFVGNTTIGVVVTNGRFDKTQMNKIAAMAQNGYARTICPVNTSADGDSLYAMSVGNIEANQDAVGTLAARVVGEAVKRAVLSAEPAYGLPAARKNLSGV